jgi:hypothetical protein
MAKVLKTTVAELQAQEQARVQKEQRLQDLQTEIVKRDDRSATTIAALRKQVAQMMDYLQERGILPVEQVDTPGGLDGPGDNGQGRD